MHHARIVRDAHRLADLQRPAHRLVDRNRLPSRLHLGRAIAPLEELHDEVGHAFRRAIDVHHVHDVGRVDLRDDARLTLEAAHRGLLVVDLGAAQDLDRNATGPLRPRQG